MSIFRRLRLDDIITSLPELGPTIPDGGYSWIVLFGIMIVQMTVPSVLTMYGIVLAHLVNSHKKFDPYVWNEKITVTPILMTAFWSLADPWTTKIVNLASVPRVMTLIGIALLSMGILASGYLATGGVAAYLASLSAGAVMGIGASLVMMQTEKIVQQHFRMKLPLARTLINVAFSIGLVLAPLVALALFTTLGIQAGLMTMIIYFIPTVLASSLLKSPGKEVSPSYNLLFNEEENESSITMLNKNLNEDGILGDKTNSGVSNPLPVDENNEPFQGIFTGGNKAYSYEDSEDIHLFVTPSTQVRPMSKQDLQNLTVFKFWATVIACIGSRAGMMLFWILLPPLLVVKAPFTYFFDGVILSITAGIGSLIVSVISYWNPNTVRSMSLIFGFSNLIGSFVLLGISYAELYIVFIPLALLGGFCIGGLVFSQEFAIRDALGANIASKSRAVLTTCVGIAILLLSFIKDMYLCLRIVGVIQFFGGIYWILFPILNAVVNQCCRRSNKNTQGIF